MLAFGKMPNARGISGLAIGKMPKAGGVWGFAFGKMPKAREEEREDSKKREDSPVRPSSLYIICINCDYSSGLRVE